MTDLEVRPVAVEDHDAWRSLYRDYRDFYGVEHSDAAVNTVWSWLLDDSHEVRGLVATIDGVPQGLAHYRRFARPLTASHGIYLDDLYTSSAARGLGIGRSLLNRLSEIARDDGATVVRWITAADNAAARTLYDRVSMQTPWVTYDLPPAPA